VIRAAVMPAPRRPIEIHELPEPSLAEGSALLRTIYAEVCGTDVHLWHGRLAGVPYPIIPGHVTVGRLEKVRGTFPDHAGRPLLESDTVVFFDVHRTCGRCYACTVARSPTRCPHRRVYGITDGLADGLFGGWAEAVYLEPGVVAARLPEGVSPEDYIGGGCGLITATHAIERAHLRPGDSVLVQGVGPVGLSAIALARLGGAAIIVAIGAPADRIELARAMGADIAIDLAASSAEERRERTLAATGGRGADVGIEAAGSARAVEEGLDLVRDGGVYVIAGHYTDAGPSTINVHRQINRKHLDIRGCWGSEPAHFLRALAMLGRHAGQVPWRRIGARTFPLEAAGEALAQAEALELPKALVRP
jgi:threonine dehydrogenase-like Zn-dependent dehydrogenase